MIKSEQAAAAQDIIREQAAYWLLESDNNDGVQTNKFQSWLAKSPQHQQIFTEMKSLWSALNPQQNAKKRSRQRRQIGAASLCVGALLLSQQLPWHYWNADYRTAVGQVSTITLADGSSATLNTNSAINVYYQHGQRKVQLVRGEVFVDVKKQVNLTSTNANIYNKLTNSNKLATLGHFTVTTPQATAQALGTRYSVKYLPESSQNSPQENTQVTVFESKVQVNSTYSDDIVILTEGQQVTVTPSNIKQSTFTVDPYVQAPDWSTQRLSFNKAPLSTVIARLNQYHPGLLFLQDNKQLNARQFTGVLPTNDITMAIDLLAQSMDLKINNISPYFIWLENNGNEREVENK